MGPDINSEETKAQEGVGTEKMENVPRVSRGRGRRGGRGKSHQNMTQQPLTETTNIEMVLSTQTLGKVQ